MHDRRSCQHNGHFAHFLSLVHFLRKTYVNQVSSEAKASLSAARRRHFSIIAHVGGAPHAWYRHWSFQHYPAISTPFTMNIFRFCGDMSHLFSIIVLLLRVRVAKNAQGAVFSLFVWCAIVGHGVVLSRPLSGRSGENGTFWYLTAFCALVVNRYFGPNA